MLSGRPPPGVSRRSVVIACIVTYFAGFFGHLQIFPGAPDHAPAPPCPTPLPLSQPRIDVKTRPPRTTDVGSQHGAVLGLARFDSVYSATPDWGSALRIFAGSLRRTGFTGAIVLHVHPVLLQDGPFTTLREALQRLKVELIPVRTAVCEFPFKPSHASSEIRRMCAEGYPKLQLEWARFALARDWITQSCRDGCGWILVTDVRDTFFQRPPFDDLGEPEGRQVMVFEEFYGDKSKTQEQGKAHGIDTTHWFAGMASKCYGEEGYRKYKGKPMLCSGQVLGTAEGMLEVLNEYLGEMQTNAEKRADCVPPELPDQPLMNYLYYHGKLSVKAVPYGDGPVMSVGGTCTTHTGRKGVRDKIDFDQNGFILDSKGRRAPVIHQWDRCGGWMEHWVRNFVASLGELVLEERWKRPYSVVVPVPNVVKLPGGWRACAEENGICDCKTLVRFGSPSQGRWSIAKVPEGNTSVHCLNEFSGGPFPDPAPGKPKVCQCKD